MAPQIKAALILGIAIVIGVGLWVYFSPYHSFGLGLAPIVASAISELGNSN
jgi:hypothetical protein